MVCLPAQKEGPCRQSHILPSVSAGRPMIAPAAYEPVGTSPSADETQKFVGERLAAYTAGGGKVWADTERSLMITTNQFVVLAALLLSPLNSLSAAVIFETAHHSADRFSS